MIINNTDALTMLNVIGDAPDVSGPGSIVIYDGGTSGGTPADCSVAISTQTLVATCPLNAGSFGAATDAGPNAQIVMATASAVEDTSANATVTAVTGMDFFRILDGASRVVAQGTVGTSGADLNFSTVIVAANDTVTITGLTIVLPEQ